MDLIARLLIFIMQNNMITQRDIAQSMAISLGSANKLISIASEQNLIAKEGSGLHITGVGEHYLDNFKMDGAVILAAGFGSRFVPLTWDTPKGLLPVFGERMIERQISQLHEEGIYDITIIDGYMKEKFD